MHKDTEKTLAALENYAGKDPIFGLTLDCINKKLGKESTSYKTYVNNLLDRAVESLELRKTPFIWESTAMSFSIGNYQDKIR